MDLRARPFGANCVNFIYEDHTWSTQLGSVCRKKWCCYRRYHTRHGRTIVHYRQRFCLWKGRTITDDKILFQIQRLTESSFMYYQYLRSNSQHSPNSCRTRFAPVPTKISSNSEPEAWKKGTPASPATALARSVFPIPGGPTRSTPTTNITNMKTRVSAQNYFKDRTTFRRTSAFQVWKDLYVVFEENLS